MCTRNALPKKEKIQKERVEPTAVVQGVMVVTWEHEDENCVFEFGHEVSADVLSMSVWWRVRVDNERHKHLHCLRLLDPELEQHGYKKVHWNEDSTLWSIQVGWFLS